MRLQLARWGNSLAIRLPVEYLRAAGLSEGDEVEAEVTPLGEIRIAPARTFDKAAFLVRLKKLHARLPLEREGAGDVVRRMRDEDRY
jgi:antitoxin MazE